jgi:hypothetical protein
MRTNPIFRIIVFLIGMYIAVNIYAAIASFDSVEWETTVYTIRNWTSETYNSLEEKEPELYNEIMSWLNSLEGKDPGLYAVKVEISKNEQKYFLYANKKKVTGSSIGTTRHSKSVEIVIETVNGDASDGVSYLYCKTKFPRYLYDKFPKYLIINGATYPASEIDLLGTGDGRLCE